MENYYLEKINHYDNLLKLNNDNEYEYKKNKYIYKLNNQQAGAETVEELFVDNEFKKNDIINVLNNNDVIILNIDNSFINCIKRTNDEDIYNINDKFSKLKEEFTKNNKKDIKLSEIDNNIFDIYIDFYNGYKIKINDLFNIDTIEDNEDDNDKQTGGSKLGFSMRNIKLLLFILKYFRYISFNDGFTEKFINKKEYTPLENIIKKSYEEIENNKGYKNLFLYNNKKNNKKIQAFYTYINFFINIMNFFIFNRKKNTKNKVYNNTELIDKYKNITELIYNKIKKSIDEHNNNKKYIPIDNKITLRDYIYELSSLFENIFNNNNNNNNYKVMLNKLKLILIRKNINLKFFKLDGILTKKLISYNNNKIMNIDDIKYIINNINMNDELNSKYIKYNNEDSYYKQISFSIDHITDKEINDNLLSKKILNKAFERSIFTYFGSYIILLIFGLVVRIIELILENIGLSFDKNIKVEYYKNIDNNYLNEMKELVKRLKK